MRPSPFVLENPNVLLVSELDWPPERDRIPHETAFLLCPRPMRSHAIGVAESLPSDCLLPHSPIESVRALHLCGHHEHLEPVLALLTALADNSPEPPQGRRIGFDWASVAEMARLHTPAGEPPPCPAPQGRLIALYGEGGSQQAAFENLQASATARLVLAARRPPAPNVLCLMQAPQPFSLGQCQPMLREMRQWWPRTGFLYGHRQASETLHRMALLLPAA